jgi:ribosomal protein S12 methylthiotransferase accessory factor YcaO
LNGLTHEVTDSDPRQNHTGIQLEKLELDAANTPVVVVIAPGFDVVVANPQMVLGIGQTAQEQTVARFQKLSEVHP